VKIAKRYRPELLVSKGKAANPILTDPYLDAKAERIVATNGHALVALPVETEKDERSRYLACSLLNAARGLGEPEVPAEIEEQELVEYGVLWPAAQERTFPDWASLMPKFRRGDAGTASLALNPTLLRALAGAMDSGGGVALTFLLTDGEAPILVQPLSPDPGELGLLPPMWIGEEEVDPGQRCPKCRKLLAAGAFCPEHGDPSAGAPLVPALEEAAEKVRKAGAAIDGADGTTITIRTHGREVTATPAQLRAGLAELDRRKSAPANFEPLWRSRGAGKGFQADLPDGGSFRVGEAKDGWSLWRVPAGKGAAHLLGVFPSQSAAKARAAELVAEDAADRLLNAAGSGDLTAKDLKGPALARKKGGRRG
jgi:hypothetical protein